MWKCDAETLLFDNKYIIYSIYICTSVFSICLYTLVLLCYTTTQWSGATHCTQPELWRHTLCGIKFQQFSSGAIRQWDREHGDVIYSTRADALVLPLASLALSLRNACWLAQPQEGGERRWSEDGLKTRDGGWMTGIYFGLKKVRASALCF